MHTDAALGQLCRQLIAEFFGEAAGKLVELLNSRGRLSAREIARRLKWPRSAALRILVSLVYARLVHYSDTNNETFYEFSAERAYQLMWLAPLISQAPSIAGLDISGAELENVLGALRKLAVNSQLRLSDLSYLSSATLSLLARARIITAARPEDSVSYEDRRLAAITQGMTQLASTREGVALSDAARKQNTAAFLAKFERDDETMRKQAQGKLLSCLSSEGANSDSDIAVKLNPERFAIRQRSLALATLVEQRVGQVSASVYRALLILSENNIEKLQCPRIPGPDTVVSSSDISKWLEKARISVDDLANAIQQPEEDNENEGADRDQSVRKKMRLASGKASAPAQNMITLINEHLSLVEQCNNGNQNASNGKLTMRCGDRNGGEWFVPFAEASDILRRSTFDELVGTMLGPSALRLLRVVRQHGKIDEKQLPQVALIQQRELRQWFFDLQHYGFVDLQEIPRGNDRAAGRQLYFWYHRPARAYSSVVSELYKTLSELCVSFKELESKHAMLLAKLQRQDVRADKSLLTPAEHEEFETYTNAQVELSQSRLQLDDYIRIFRDY